MGKGLSGLRPPADAGGHAYLQIHSPSPRRMLRDKTLLQHGLLYVLTPPARVLRRSDVNPGLRKYPVVDTDCRTTDSRYTTRFCVQICADAHMRDKPRGGSACNTRLSQPARRAERCAAQGAWSGRLALSRLALISACMSERSAARVSHAPKPTRLSPARSRCRPWRRMAQPSETPIRPAPSGSLRCL